MDEKTRNELFGFLDDLLEYMGDSEVLTMKDWKNFYSAEDRREMRKKMKRVEAMISKLISESPS